MQFFASVAPSYATEVSEASVTALVAQLDKAISARDAEGVGRLISPGVKMTWVVSVNGVRQVAHLNKAQYMEMLRAGWAQAEEYSYERKNTTIRVSGGRAMLSGTVIERMRLGGERITGRSTESATVELVGGRLLITEIKAESLLQ